jgi:hypothetical protein
MGRKSDANGTAAGLWDHPGADLLDIERRQAESVEKADALADFAKALAAECRSCQAVTERIREWAALTLAAAAGYRESSGDDTSEPALARRPAQLKGA